MVFKSMMMMTMMVQVDRGNEHWTSSDNNGHIRKKKRKNYGNKNWPRQRMNGKGKKMREGKRKNWYVSITISNR